MCHSLLNFYGGHEYSEVVSGAYQQWVSLSSRVFVLSVSAVFSMEMNRPPILLLLFYYYS